LKFIFVVLQLQIHAIIQHHQKSVSFFIITGWHVFKFQMEEAAFKYIS